MTQPRAGVGAVVIHNDALLVVQRAKEPGKGLWAVPGGKVEWGETVAETAEREVFEETGVRIVAGPVIWTGESIGTDHHFVLLDVEGTYVEGEPVANDDAAQATWVPLAELRSLPLTPTMYSLLDTIGVE